MALPTETSIRLYVTHVDGEDHFLKISGQLDQQAPLMLESLFLAARENLEKGLGAVPMGAIHEGIVCAAKYKDGTYYRAKVINTSNITNGLVGVHFIDYGNRDIISLSTIRFLDKYDPMFLQLRGQATDYYLARVIHPSGRWDDALLQKLQTLLCYSDYPANIDSNTPIPLISIKFKGQDLSQHLSTIRFGVAIQISQQEALLMKDNQQPKWQPSMANDPQAYSEHVPFLLNQNFPSNPASAMRLQQNAPLPFNGTVSGASSLISQRLLVNNKVSRNTINLKAPARQPQVATHTHNSSVPHSVPSAGVPSPGLLMKVPITKPTSPKKSSTYKSRLLEANSQHKVFVSYAEEGPELFAVQVAVDCNKLQDMMDEINRRPHSSLAEPPMIGTVCLGRMSGDRIICRAIVMNLSGSQCKLFFVDFGDTEMVSYYDIFDIPEEFVKPNVFAMRFCLSGVKKLEKGPHLNETFKQLVSGQILTLKVVPPEGPPLIQYGELYLDDKNVLDLLMANMKDKLQFKWMGMLPLGTRQSVLVSYVDTCIKFYVQLSDKIDDLNAVMEAVKNHCENSKSPGELPVGSACCARFSDDGNWYRARVRDTKGKKIIVAYVDYGNEQEVNVSDLRTITADLIKLPAQALKCALKGFENRPVETKTSNQLEMLALEKTLMANIVGVLSSDTMLVTLVDDTTSPPLDIARKMNQLSQPRSSHEPKATTPIRKDAPETFSSPEESQPEDRRSFRREKSFKEERTRLPREENSDFSRGGSFRGRDNKESFDRSGPGRHSEKFGGRPAGDRNERYDRRGPKPWETNQTSPPQNAEEDDWVESSSQSSHQPPRREFNRDNNRDNRDNFRERDNNRERDNFRDNRDRRKPRSEQHDSGRPNWKKDIGGAGKRLRQAVEESSADTQNVSVPRGSIQDRLKRDRYNQPEEREERKNEEWGNRNREYRPPRENRDNRGDRRDNWTEKKDWGQKRDFRENKGERSERPPRSNFSPRDRAEKSFGSEKSFKSQDSGGQARPAPFKPRSMFTQVQYKELPDPIALDTPFVEPSVELGAQHEVSVTWIISPESFHTQILTLQQKFLDMMHQIPELYKGVKPFTGEIPIGSNVLARYPADGVLYRATVVSVQPFSKFIVRYVDFGNKQLVDVRDIWQLDRSLLELPKMAIHCSLIGVSPKDDEWKADTEIDLCFNAPRYQCVFQECVEEIYKVSLWNNGVSVADTLVEKQLAKMSEHQSSVTLKDEPIDMTIIVGQQIMCRVTHVESFNEFYVQLDIEKAALVEETLVNFDVAKLTPPSADMIADGTHCTVKHEGKIYRAILQDVSDTSNIKMVLPDYGNTIATSVDNLMILPSELSVYYYQSLHGSLNNYTESSNKLMSLDELKSRLTGNKFIIYINDVDGITLVSTLYDSSTGQKVAIFEPDEGAYDAVTTLCMRAVFNYNFGMAYISHAENLNEIYLQKSTDGDRITEMLNELYKFYEEGTPEPLTSYEVNEVCVAKSTDSNWYRATIVSVQDTQVQVQFTDYGNCETLPKESLKKLDAKFIEPCALALVASLGLVALQENALSTLTEWSKDKEIQVTLSFGNDGWLANLHLDGVDLSMKLINEKLATPQVATVEEENQQEEPEAPVEEPISLPPGCTQVYISHIDTPGHFWLQMVDKVDNIEEIQAELQANADSYPDVENREMGTPCIAKYLADEQWYRAEILDADADITTVRFVDYGNTDVLDNQPGLIKTMPEKLNAIERYGVRASVNAVPTGTGEWSEAASESFTQLVGDLSTPVDALIVLKDVTTYVDIFVAGQNLTDKLVTEGHAARSEEAECGDLPSCFASHVNSPSEFWIQLESATAELQVMEEAMVDAENFPELKDKEEGVVCAAMYPEDGAWYRAQVIVDGSEGTEVLFMDYGNASITNELRSLPDDLKVKPALSRKCALQKPRDIKTWSRRSEVKFNELAAEGATIFNVQFIASGDISIVELYLEGKSVTEELVGLCEEQVSVPERPTPVGQDLQSSGKICYVQSVNEFYVNIESASSDLEKVTEAMYNAQSLESASELKVGSVCAAFWSENSQWYRARILEFCDVGYHVLFIDFGNKAKCEEFRQLPEEFAIMEPLAKCCRLAGVPDHSIFQENGKNKLDDLALEDATLKIEFLDSSNEPMLVKLVVDDKDVLSLISSEKQDTADIPDIIKGIDENKTVSVTPEMNPEECRAQETVKTEEKTDSIIAKEGIIDEKAAEKEELISDKIVEKEKLVEEPKESAVEAVKEELIAETTAEEPVATDDKDEFEDAEEQNTSIDLNDSLESNHTVIENKSFDADIENLNADTAFEDFKDETPSSPEKDISSETLENSNDTIKTPEREESKDDKSIEKDSPTKYFVNETETKVEEPKESVNKTEDAKADEISDKVTVESKDKLENAKTATIDVSAEETLENSNDTIKTPEREESKDSITDTGYTSDDKSIEKDSPTKSIVDKTETKREERDEISENVTVESKDKLENPKTAAKDVSAKDTFENYNDTIKTPEREESKDSTTDTGYTSDDKPMEKDSPTKSFVDKTETKGEEPKESVNKTEDVKADEISEKVTVQSKDNLENPKTAAIDVSAKEDLNKTI